MFSNNKKSLLHSYCTNTSLPGFEKTSLELLSMIYRVRILVYNVSDEKHLNALIVNNNFTRTIEIIRTHGFNYATVYSN